MGGICANAPLCAALGFFSQAGCSTEPIIEKEKGPVNLRVRIYQFLQSTQFDPLRDVFTCDASL